MNSSFKEYYLQTKEKIDQKIQEFNQEMEEESSPLLKENFEYFTNLNKDGKLVRGTLVNLGYSLLKEDTDYSLDLSLAYEVFQTGILVHDDIIDNDDTRRGKETIHFVNTKKYQKYTDNKEEAKHLSDSIAICMGDYGLYEANRIISERYATCPNLGKVLSNFNRTVLTTIKGELLDVILPFQGKHELISTEDIEKNILEIYRLKTSHYTIIGPMSVGILLAGGDDNKLKDIEAFGEKVGIAFQIQDDVLGIYSSEMGKVKGSDIKEFKQTVLYSHILNTPYKDEFLEIYGNDNIDDERIEKVQDLLKKAGSYDYAIQLMNTMYDEALSLLDGYDWIKEEKKELLRGFVNYLRERNK
ncbi:MAG: polyprenyl synthetase family protein [Bacilli bacterium]|nr:polyprenyl synthetase family protein [Bacilli bacterium]